MKRQRDKTMPCVSVCKTTPASLAAAEETAVNTTSHPWLWIPNSTITQVNTDNCANKRADHVASRVAQKAGFFLSRHECKGREVQFIIHSRTIHQRLIHAERCASRVVQRSRTLRRKVEPAYWIAWSHTPRGVRQCGIDARRDSPVGNFTSCATCDPIPSTGDERSG